MPRYKRDCPPGTTQHIIQRFINREFRFDDATRGEYLRRLGRVAAQTDWLWLAYALMSSHVHHGNEAGQRPLAEWTKRLNSGVAQYLNRRQGRLGPVFADRPKSVGCKEEETARLLAYIHNNPVRAGVVSDPAASTWTSHRVYVGEVRAPRWLAVERGLAASGFSASPSGRMSFHRFVCDSAGAPRDEMISDERMLAARVEARCVAGRAVEIGYANPGPEGGNEHAIWRVAHAPVFSLWRGDLELLLSEVCSATPCTVDEVRLRTKRRACVRARRLLLITGRLLGRTMSELAALVGLSASSAAYLLQDQTTDSDALALAAAIAERIAGFSAELSGSPDTETEKLKTVPR